MKFKDAKTGAILDVTNSFVAEQMKNKPERYVEVAEKKTKVTEEK